MKAAVLGCVLGALVAIAAAEPATVTETFALTTIDTVPTRTQLDGALGSDGPPLDKLIGIAEDESNDTGVRLRAISALPRYCPCGSDDPVTTALHALLPPDPPTASGKDLVLLRATIESLAQLQQQGSDTTTLETLLNHPSRDIRASAARALATMCDSSAISSLRVRYQNESTDQVKLAISAALRILPCSVN